MKCILANCEWFHVLQGNRLTLYLRRKQWLYVIGLLSIGVDLDSYFIIDHTIHYECCQFMSTCLTSKHLKFYYFVKQKNSCFTQNNYEKIIRIKCSLNGKRKPNGNAVTFSMLQPSIAVYGSSTYIMYSISMLLLVMLLNTQNSTIFVIALRQKYKYML